MGLMFFIAVVRSNYDLGSDSLLTVVSVPYEQRDQADMVEFVRNTPVEFREYYIQMQVAKRSQAPVPSQVINFGSLSTLVLPYAQLVTSMAAPLSPLIFLKIEHITGVIAPMFDFCGLTVFQLYISK